FSDIALTPPRRPASIDSRRPSDSCPKDISQIVPALCVLARNIAQPRILHPVPTLSSMDQESRTAGHLPSRVPGPIAPSLRAFSLLAAYLRIDTSSGSSGLCLHVLANSVSSALSVMRLLLGLPLMLGISPRVGGALTGTDIG